jgi:putative endonuclease
VAGHFVYIAACRDGSLYTGYTTDPIRRIEEHNSGRGSRYTRTRRPVRLAYLEEMETRAEALRREIQVKGLSREAKGRLCSEFESRKKKDSRPSEGNQR